MLSLSDWLRKKKGGRSQAKHSIGNQCRNTPRATDNVGRYLSADVMATHYKNDNTNLFQQTVAFGEIDTHVGNEISVFSRTFGENKIKMSSKMHGHSQCISRRNTLIIIRTLS